MSEIEGATASVSSPPQEEQPHAPALEASTMSETDVSKQQNPTPLENLSQRIEKLNIQSSFSIWPPTQRTRDAVVNRLIETLSQPSVVSKRYGSMPPEEASVTAHAIEKEAFHAASVASGSEDAASVEHGIEILQVYSLEISKRMLDAVKSRATAVTTPEVASVQSTAMAPTATGAETVTSEEVSSVDNELA
ncbi:hypothetical protein Nepgr_005830 [Nepenthes gracilis]|uniref:WPP domain-containing protein n=1 Tax=Nepenthes gracilis TaxID=150966 RepID=A0AAD3XGY7_NEPGR|nr:hypothetical protein Nepgr_005830 [Nepenthes gracilis]